MCEPKELSTMEPSAWLATRLSDGETALYFDKQDAFTDGYEFVTPLYAAVEIRRYQNTTTLTRRF